MVIDSVAGLSYCSRPCFLGSDRNIRDVRVTSRFFGAWSVNEKLGERGGLAGPDHIDLPKFRLAMGPGLAVGRV